MKRTGLATVILLTLWIAASNHCFFESFFSNSSSEVSSNAFGGDCPSHGTGDSQEHPEGGKCSVSVATEANKVSVDSHANLIKLVPVAIFLANLGSSASIGESTIASDLPIPHIVPPTEQLASVISPNAPPSAL